MRTLQFEDAVPYASVTTNSHEQKVYEQNTIFLNNGQTFEIKLFNPTKFKLGVNVSINGQSSDKLLVLNPGQQFLLDRFLDDKRKMLYETYEIDGSNEQAVKAIEKNGDIEISFFKEKIQPMRFTGSLTTSGLPHYGNFTTTNLNSRLYGNSTYTSGAGSKIKGKQMSSDTKSLKSKKSRGISGQSFESPGVPFYTTDNSTFTSSLNISNDMNFADFNQDNLLETGRVEKGEESNQNFQKVDVNFESNPYYVINYKLLPISQKQTVTTQEIRSYCPACSYRKRKTSWKFCPACGEKY
jgi:hypothetical protein